MRILLPVILLSAVDAKLQWLFKNDIDNSEASPILKAQIGTPGQSVQLRISQDSSENYLGVPSKRNMFGGNFDPDKSPTFKQIGSINNDGDVGVIATDTFLIGGTILNNLPFNVYDKGVYYDGIGSLSIAYSNVDSNFIRALLSTQENQTVAISFDHVSYFNKPGPISGVLTLGGQPEQCVANWTRLNETSSRDHSASWSVRADLITVSKYQKRNPGTIQVLFDTDQFTIPYTIYDSLARAVGSNDGITIPCDTTTEIVLSVSGVDLVIGPETYLGKIGSGQCVFAAEQFTENEKFYQLPVGILKDWCFGYDYETREVLFAPKL